MMECFSIFSFKTKRRGNVQRERTENEKGRDFRRFSISELETATNNFNESSMIGKGGCASVHKGSIRPADRQGETRVVAIKFFNRVFTEGHKEWLEKVEFIGVKLLGYCWVVREDNLTERLLVYEYMPNMSLAYHLFSRQLPPIPWTKRLQILLSAATGLAYLHEGLDVEVIFRDFKSANVLLDENLNPKLSNFVLETQELFVSISRHIANLFMAE